VKETTWAGNYADRAQVQRPATFGELQETVAGCDRVRALGSRHSFTDIAETEGVLVSLDGLPTNMVVDEDARTVAVGGGTRYGEVAAFLHARGWALANLASLPHISVAGAVATGTHGSGDRVESLAAAVSAHEVVGPDGELRQLARGHADFDGSVVGLGALGIVSPLTHRHRAGVPGALGHVPGPEVGGVHDHFDAITSGAYSVSMFTDFVGAVDQVWLKSRTTSAPEGVFGAVRAPETVHMLAGAPVDAVTQQLGPWHERLPHFGMSHTPSRGGELQSEYLLARKHALTAFSQMRRLSAVMAPVLQSADPHRRRRLAMAVQQLRARHRVYPLQVGCVSPWPCMPCCRGSKTFSCRSGLVRTGDSASWLAPRSWLRVSAVGGLQGAARPRGPGRQVRQRVAGPRVSIALGASEGVHPSLTAWRPITFSNRRTGLGVVWMCSQSSDIDGALWRVLRLGHSPGRLSERRSA